MQRRPRGRNRGGADAAAMWLPIPSKEVIPLKILGTGSALPKKVVTNDDLAGFLETNDEWISTRTGIRERRVLSDDTL